jgi:murein DD-endopeptidase MepM/ murein hydrolase activator NlpD
VTIARPFTGPVSSEGHFGWRRLAGEGPTFHGGLDFVGEVGAPVRAAKAGIVLEAAPTGVHARYGNVVVIKHDDQSESPLSLYAHLRTIRVRKGRRVRAGQVIGTLGDTAGVPGNPYKTVMPHLHFELLRQWPALPDVGRLDPTPYLAEQSAGVPLLYPSYVGPLAAVDVPQASGKAALIGAGLLLSALYAGRR